jgi:hypothetical protein
VCRLSRKILGSRGSGKTLYLAYELFLDLLAGVGGIVIDPVGKITEYLTQRIAYSGHPELWERLIYVPVGGLRIPDPGDTRSAKQLSVEDVLRTTWVIPTPFFYDRTGHDFLEERAARYVAMIAMLHPESKAAPISGLPAVEQTTNFAGMLLAAMGKQLVPDAAWLIEGMWDHTAASPSVWADEIERIAATHPYELERPAKYFLERFPKLRDSDQKQDVATFLREINPYSLNPRLGGQYGANAWGVDITGAERGKLIIFDFSTLPDTQFRTGLYWIFTHCMEYLKARGSRRDVINFVIDDLHRFVNEDNPLIEEALNELIVVFGRNYGISCGFSYQEVLQPPEGLRLALDMVGYSLYAGSSDPDSARRLAQLLDDFQPHWIKDREVIRSDRTGYYVNGVFEGDIEREIITYYTALEQELLHAQRHRDRPGLTFALATANKEGDAARYRATVQIRNIRDTHVFDKAVEAQARERLVKTHGRRVSDILAEIAKRKPRPIVIESESVAKAAKTTAKRQRTLPDRQPAPTSSERVKQRRTPPPLVG